MNTFVYVLFRNHNQSKPNCVIGLYQYIILRFLIGIIDQYVKWQLLIKLKLFKLK